jgi:signal transduction histidine kinase
LPLHVLTTSAKNISLGNLSEKLTITTNDEIGELTEAFNLMNSEIFARNNELSRERSERYAHIIDAQENERIKLARDLHDGIGQVFIALKLQLETLNDMSPQDSVTIEKIKKTINTAIDEIRNFSYALIPPVLREFGLVAAVKNMVQSISSLSGIEIVFNNDLKSNIKDEKIGIYLFRIIQELVNNIVKHSNAKRAEIKLNESLTEITLMIADNGCGFDLNESKYSRGNGLYGISERVRALSGEIDIQSSGEGTSVRIVIPIIN